MAENRESYSLLFIALADPVFAFCKKTNGSKHLYLVAPPATGKSTLIKEAATYPGCQFYTPGGKAVKDCPITFLDFEPETPYAAEHYKLLRALKTSFVVLGCSPEWGGSSASFFTQLGIKKEEVEYFSLIQYSVEAEDGIKNWLTHRLQCRDSGSHSLTRALMKEQEKKGTNLPAFVRNVLFQHSGWRKLPVFDKDLSAGILARLMMTPPEISKDNFMTWKEFAPPTWQGVGMMPSAPGTVAHKLSEVFKILTGCHLFIQTKDGKCIPLDKDGNPPPDFDFNTALYLGVKIDSISMGAVCKLVAPFKVSTNGLVMAGYEEVIGANVSGKPQKGKNPPTVSGGHITLYFGALTPELLKELLQLIPAEITLDQCLINGGFCGFFSSNLTQLKGDTFLHLSLSTDLIGYPLTARVCIQDSPANASSAAAASSSTD